MKTINLEVIQACQNTVKEEENEDTQLRTQHGPKWNRPPSAAVNQTYKQSLFEYQQKLENAMATDVQIRTKFEANREGFALLSKTRQDLAAMIPQTANASQIDSDPAVVAIKDCLA